jgi:VWFA-related protein
VRRGQHTRQPAVVRALFAPFVALAIVAMAATQESKPRLTEQLGQQPPIRTGTEMVRVDVSVVDRRGTPVTTLTADDFEVHENGVPQPIKSFKLVEVSGEPEPGDDTSLEIRSVSHAAAEASRDDVRVFLIFWDEYHIDRFTSTLRAREALSRFVLTAFGSTDLVAFMDPLTPSDAITFTRDRRLLADTASRLKGRYRVYIPPRSAAEEAQLERPREIERLRAEVTSTALESAVVHLGALKEGRKSLIVVSEGQGVPDSFQTFERLNRLANDNNTAIYVLDPRGLSAGMASMLGSLAASTGGEFFRSNDLEGSLGRVLKESRAFYLIGYDASASPKDGRFHEIRVRLKRSGYDVKARRGYWAPSVADLTRTRTPAPELPKAVAEALSLLTPALSPRAADVWIGIEPGENLRSRMRLAWSPRGPRQPASRSAATASAVVTGQNGGLFAGPLDERGLTIDVPGGTAMVTVTVHDAGGEVIDRVTRTILVPDVNASALAISTPSVFRASTAFELRALQTSTDPAPFAGREFARADRLLLRFVISGRSSADAKVEASLLNAKGSLSTRLPISSIAHSRPTESASTPVLRWHEIDLPLTTFAPADWLVLIEASAGEDRAESIVAFRIVR